MTTSKPTATSPAPKFRIGQGWDTHALVAGRPLILGGVTIPYHLGLLGHSDADALLHAIIDAMLGAAAMGDIGGLFPDTNTANKDADSSVLTRIALAKVHAAGWRVANLDCTVIAQAPKLALFKAAMTAHIAQLLAVDAQCVNIKAKTAEKMGPVGEGKSIEAQAVVLLYKA